MLETDIKRPDAGKEDANQAIDEHNQEKISQCTSMASLIDFVSREMDSIEGTKATYTAEEVAQQLEEVEKLSEDNPILAMRFLKSITRSLGLRERVGELLGEKIEAGVREAVNSSDSFDDLYSKLRTIKRLRGSHANYAAADLIMIIRAMEEGKKLKYKSTGKEFSVKLKHIPKVFGLRGKVEDLLEAKK